MRPLRILLSLLVSLFAVSEVLAAEPATKASSDGASPVVAIFELDGPLVESPVPDLFLFSEQPVSLRELMKRMRDAADDDNIKAVVLLAEDVRAGAAQVEELRQAIAHVRSKGKDVLVHSDSLSLGDYLVFSGATKISMVPTADLWVLGLHAEQPYLRRLLDKIGVEPDFTHVGDYKSAAEIFTRNSPSAQADEMTNWLIDSLYASGIELIAKGRKVDAAKVKSWIDQGHFSAEEAKSAGLIDAVEQRQDFDAALKKKYGDALTYDRKYGKKKDPEIDFSNPFALFKVLGEMFAGPRAAEPKKDAVGIVYVDGMILPGSGRGSIFGPASGAFSSDIRKALDEAARDESIKAVVLRVDSPGGSAVASEIILDATKRLKAKKPLVVSMGNVAGSGGYYVSLGADTIYADQMTITASIGVVAGKFVTNPMWSKIGIDWKSYDRGAMAGLLASDEPFSDAERKRLEQWMNTVYDTFRKHVTDSRGGKLKKPLEEMAGGRVYTGKQALELGLIDKIGSLQDAVADVAARAKMGSDYDVRVVPQPKNFIEQLLEQSGGGPGRGEGDKWIRTSGPSLVDLATPYLKHLDPKRVALVRQALMRLQLLGDEGVILTSPELRVLD